MSVPVIDLFAGPGGLGEGFSSLEGAGHLPCFRIRLSVEKEESAHRTLKLRSFFRQFPRGSAPDEYYEFLSAKKKPETLYQLEKYKSEVEKADSESWCAELRDDPVFNEDLDRRVTAALDGYRNWVLIGGPPCQAYSLMGRARNKGEKRKEYRPEEDRRHFLYQEYLRIIARHKPAIFVMENVKGILSSKVKGNHIFKQIMQDLSSPGECFPEYLPGTEKLGYRIFSLVKEPNFDSEGRPFYDRKEDFIVHSEEYGIPQARHRVILLGVREDLCTPYTGPRVLKTMARKPGVRTMIGNLPNLRSGISRKNSPKIENTTDNWISSVRDFPLAEISPELGDMAFRGIVTREEAESVIDEISRARESIGRINAGLGDEYIPGRYDLPEYLDEWFHDRKLKGIFNHTARTHIVSDLHRYLYASCFAKALDRSPKVSEFPESLKPAHKNRDTDNFADRFKVQRPIPPSTTITSHISKDGHYFIHYDPRQCRSLTVREAARLQTFPDNYFFCGNRTEQYVQVGNAVPPMLARRIAEVVNEFLGRVRT